jgi:cytochrome c556
MKLHTLLIVGFVFVMAGCTEKDQAVPEAADEAQAPPPVAEAPPMKVEEWRKAEFLEHMHRHADYLDNLNIALAEGDIVAAMTPAYWVSRHDSVEGVPAEWQQYLDGMRAASLAVEKSTDLDSARTAAEQITVQCQGCHAAAGVLAE